MFDTLAKKWTQLFTVAPASGRTKYTFDELRALYDVLAKNQVVTEANRAVVVETIRSIAEFMIWGDQNEPRIFDFFLEHNIMNYLHRVLQQPANRTGDVAKQVLQTLSIIIQNIRSETGTYFLFSNNHVNNIVEIRFDFDDEEVLGYYISFLKTISLKLNQRTVQFFFDSRESTYTFPLYSEAVKFAHHKEGMVRAGVRTLTLNVYSVADTYIQEYVSRPPATSYFADIASYIADQVKILDKRMAAAEGFNAQVLSSLDSQLAEVEDMVSYVADILSTGGPPQARAPGGAAAVGVAGGALPAAAPPRVRRRKDGGRWQRR
ncbi:Protein CLEC16A [Tetrabaena socialis]|uniref:Protein CLEC16A n=1 Tax=Tetrabaena socialis TaxID=47790 RepID=A0A2J7ZNE5_9CHLO|nr:Protein CLEC16A [Tetrabaena socialis]|eukprot:PNH01778.1 Protein CLEC16A [Tetrabaena socialis]